MNKLITTSLLILTLFSCKTPQEKVRNIFSKYPLLSQTECVQRFPPKETTIIKTEYKQGKTDTLIHTFFTDCDTVKPDTITKLRLVKCPPSIRIVDTFIVDSSKVTIDNIALDLEKKLHTQTLFDLVLVKEELKQKKNTIKKLTVGILSLLSLVGIIFFVLYKRK